MGSSSPSSLRMRSATAASTGPRPSSMLVVIEPGITLNSTNTTSATAAMVGKDCKVRRNVKASIRGSLIGGSLGRRTVLDPDVFRILVRQLGSVRLQPLDPGLIRHHGLVVVEEPDRRFVVENGVGLAQQRNARLGVIGLAGLIQQSVEFRILVPEIVAGGHRRRGVEALERVDRIRPGLRRQDEGLELALAHRVDQYAGLHL